MADQIQFSADGSIHSRDGQVLNRGTDHSVALSDTQKANVGIRVHNTSDTFRFQQNGGPSTAAPSITSVQLAAKTNLVKVGGYDVTPEVAATLAEVAPSLTEDPSVKAMEAAKEVR